MLYVKIHSTAKDGSEDAFECVKDYPIGDALSTEMGDALREAYKVRGPAEHDYDIRLRSQRTLPSDQGS